jgi:hypothetical protein
MFIKKAFRQDSPLWQVVSSVFLLSAWLLPLSSELLCSIISWQYSASVCTFASTHKADEVIDPWHTLLLPHTCYCLSHTVLCFSLRLIETVIVLSERCVEPCNILCVTPLLHTQDMKGQGGPINTVTSSKVTYTVWKTEASCIHK